MRISAFSMKAVSSGFLNTVMHKPTMLFSRRPSLFLLCVLRMLIKVPYYNTFTFYCEFILFVVYASHYVNYFMRTEADYLV